MVGYVMDSYCINRGRLLDNPSKDSLSNPDLHTVHCLVDVTLCRDGGYELLADPQGDSKTHCRAYKLDNQGNDLVVALARLIGDCSTCDGEGNQTKGFRATVRGKVRGTGKRPLLAVSELLPAAVGCPDGVSDLPELDCSSGEDQPWIVTHGTFMLVSWGVMLPSGVIIARLLKHKPKGLWFKIHRAMQITGLMIAFTGWVIALTRFDVFSAGSSGNLSYTHGALGCATMTLGILQPINAFFRPHVHPGEAKSTKRRGWEYLHKGSGYTAVILAVATIGIGVTRPAREEDQMAFQVTYAVVVVFLIALMLGLLYDGFRAQPELIANAQKEASSEKSSSVSNPVSTAQSDESDAL